MLISLHHFPSLKYFLGAVMGVLLVCMAQSAHADSREALERDSRNALNSLMAQNHVARDLHARAAAVLVFPSVKKAGLMVGAQYGEGVLWQNGKATA